MDIFDDDKKAYFTEWLKRKKILALRNSLRAKSKEELILLLLAKTYEYELLEMTCEEYGEDEDLLYGLYKRVRKNEKGLDDGRKKGVDVRKRLSDEKHERIKKVIDDLYRVKKGFEMAYPEIADYLLDNKIANYKYSVMLQLVKKMAPSIKQKYKSGQ